MLVPYALACKGVKWYRKLVELFIDFSIYNSFINWKKLNKQSNLTNLKFRLQHLETIFMNHLTEEGRNHPSPLGKEIKIEGESLYQPYSYGGDQQTCSKEICSVHFDAKTDTRFQCTPWNVPLCIELCFKIYHTCKYFSYNNELFCLIWSIESLFNAPLSIWIKNCFKFD